MTNCLSLICNNANLTLDENKAIPEFISGDKEFYGTQAFQKLYAYFAFESLEMPYGVAKARTGDPDSWILDKLEHYSGLA